MSVIQTFVIQGRLPGLNDMISAARSHKNASAQQKKTYTDLVTWTVKAAKLRQMNYIDVLVRWYEGDKHRDKDNIQAGVKFILDGLVQAGVIENDNWKHVGDISHKVDVDRRNPRIEVILEEVQA